MGDLARTVATSQRPSPRRCAVSPPIATGLRKSGYGIVTRLSGAARILVPSRTSGRGHRGRRGPYLPDWPLQRIDARGIRAHR